MADLAPPHVAILMAVYNGAAYLPAQLDSLLAQDHDNWSLIVGDDGSTDATPGILRAFAARHPATLVSGPRKGAAAHFMALIRHAARHAAPGHYLAFCDQDDVWLRDRLSRGVKALGACGEDRPALYCSRTWITGPDLEGCRLSAGRPRGPSFRNALVQNIASGNTILLNPAAARLLETAAEEVTEVVVHDWWVYQLVTGAGGQVIHDDDPTVFYRQHGLNQIGENSSAMAKFRRIWQMLRGDFRAWNTVNLAALTRLSHHLTEENRRIMQDFAAMRRGPLPQRLARLWQLGLYRQSRMSTLALWLAVVLNRI